MSQSEQRVIQQRPTLSAVLAQVLPGLRQNRPATVGVVILVALGLALPMATAAQPKVLCVAVAALVVLVLTVARPSIVLAFVAYGLYLAPPRLLLFGLRLPDYQQLLMPLALLIALSPVITRQKRLNLQTWELIVPVALLGTMWLSTWVGVGVSAYKYFVKSFVTPLGLYYVLRIDAERLGGMETLLGRMLTCYAISGGIIALERIVGTHYIYGEGEPVGEGADLGVVAPYVGAGMSAVLAPLLVAKAVMETNSTRRWLWLLGLASALTIVFLNTERSAILGVGAGLVVLLAHRRFHGLLIPIAAIGALLAGWGWMNSARAMGRLRHKAPVEYRQGYWPVAWSVLQGESWPKALGFGFGGYTRAVPKLVAASPDIVPDISVERGDTGTIMDFRELFESGIARPHNDFLTFPLEFGLVGSALAVLLGVSILIHWVRLCRAGRRGDVTASVWAVAFVASFAGWLVNAATHNMYILRDVSMTVALVLAWAITLSRQRVQRQKDMISAGGPGMFSPPRPGDASL